MITDETLTKLSTAFADKCRACRENVLHIKLAFMELIEQELGYSSNVLADYDCFKRFEKDRDKAEKVLADDQDFGAVVQEFVDQLDAIETNDLYKTIGDVGAVFDILNDAIDVVYHQNQLTDCVIKNNILYLTERNVIQMVRKFMHDNEKSELWHDTIRCAGIFGHTTKDRVNFIVDCAFTTYDDNGFMIGGEPFAIDNEKLSEHRNRFDILSSDILGGSADVEDDLVAMHDPIFSKGIDIDMSMISVALGFEELSKQAYQIFDDLFKEEFKKSIHEN